MVEETCPSQYLRKIYKVMLSTLLAGWKMELRLRFEMRETKQNAMPNAHHLHSEEPERDETMRW